MPTVRAATAPVTTRRRAARLPVEPGVAWNMRSPFRPDRTVRSQVCGARSLDRARGEPTDDEALSEDDEQEGGQQGEHDAGEHHARVVGVGGLQLPDADLDGLVLRRVVMSSGQKYMFQADSAE